MPPKRIRFRAKVTSAGGDKLHIIIPKFYHKDIFESGYKDQVVQVEIRDISSSDTDVVGINYPNPFK